MGANADIGKLILRLALGGMMFLHGIAKLGSDLGFIKTKLVESGMPEFFAYGVYIGEIVAPILIIIGLKMKESCWLIIATMAFVIYLVFPNSILALNNHGAWAIELQMFYVFVSLALIFLGAGKYSIDRH